MKIRFHKSFSKQFKQLSKSQKELVKGALETFEEDPYHDSLRNHPLKKEWKGYHSITADTDLRLHFRMLDDDTALFVAAGSHYVLYK